MTGAGFADAEEDGEFAEFYSADEAGPRAPRAPCFVDQFRRLFCWATPPPAATPEPPPPAPAAPPPTQAQPLLPPGLGCGRGPRNTPGAPAVRATAY